MSDSIIELLWSRLAQSILKTHPNDVDVDSAPQEWDMCADTVDWAKLVSYYNGEAQSLPTELKQFVDKIVALERLRGPDVIEKADGQPDMRGMSPKKSHEVHRMTEYIVQLLDDIEKSTGVRIEHVVDVGAGQGYLSRALAKSGLKVLALDSNESQTSGAKSRQMRGKASEPILSSLTHKTTHINAETLLAALNEWIEGQTSTPVLVVALHACGSLTPEILRAFVSSTRDPSSSWRPAALVGVGCCYNLMASKEFPLSKAHTSSWNTHAPTPHLPEPWLHLAAQIPGAWFRTSSNTSAAVLALRKVVWRAILVPVIREAELNRSNDAPVQTPAVRIHPGTSIKPNLPRPVPQTASAGINHEVQRLGRLNDAAYVDWETFVSRAREKMGLDVTEPPRIDGGLQRRLELLHVLRCLLGPLIETLVLEDRVQWLKEELVGEGLDVRMVNLFDQATGSGRNVGIVIASSKSI